MSVQGLRILDRWLMGYTCHAPHNRREIMLETDTHIVLKHFGHMGYTDRVRGVTYCPAYAHLYLKKALYMDNRAIMYGRDPVKEWKGRETTLKRVTSDCKAMGVL